jgi:hypothetical protein
VVAHTWIPSTPLGRLRQEDWEFEASLGYVVRSYLFKNINKLK